jgi:hypothetical protein
MAKKYLVKVYNKAGSYLNTWNEVISDITFQNEINTAGGQMTITLARKAGDYGEGSDIDFGYKVVVYVFDKELLDGKILFQGFISGYTPIYKNDTVQVSVLSYGETLNTIFIEDTPAVDITNTTNDTRRSTYYRNNGLGTVWLLVGQSFTPTTNQKLFGCIARINNTGTASINYYARLYDATKESVFPDKVWVLSDNWFVQGNDFPATAEDTIPLLSVSIPVNISVNASYTDYQFTFPDEIEISTTKKYYIIFSPVLTFNDNSDVGFRYNSTSSLSNSDYVNTIYSGGSSVIYPIRDISRDLYFKTLYKTGATNVPFLSTDPSNIVKTILDSAKLKGSLIDYNNTVDLTNTTVNYTFNVNTTLEGIKKSTELAPKDWYWFIDYGNNYLHFTKKTDLPTHIFSLEKDILDAKFEKRIEDIVNVVLFTGGDTGSGTNFYKKYSNQNSIDKYGYRAIRYTDQRVTTASTADTIANAILEVRSEPELRVTIEVLDSNNEQGLGYDIESLQVGDTVAVRNVTQQVGLSTWDVARWDEASWDYSIYNLSSLNMQIQRIEYNQDRATLYASTLAVDVNKRIEDINRNLEQSIVANNPTTPS